MRIIKTSNYDFEKSGNVKFDHTTYLVFDTNIGKSKLDIGPLSDETLNKIRNYFRDYSLYDVLEMLEKRGILDYNEPNISFNNIYGISLESGWYYQVGNFQEVGPFDSKQDAINAVTEDFG